MRHRINIRIGQEVVTVSLSASDKQLAIAMRKEITKQTGMTNGQIYMRGLHASLEEMKEPSQQFKNQTKQLAMRESKLMFTPFIAFAHEPTNIRKRVIGCLGNGMDIPTVKLVCVESTRIPIEIDSDREHLYKAIRDLTETHLLEYQQKIQYLMLHGVRLSLLQSLSFRSMEQLYDSKVLRIGH